MPSRRVIYLGQKIVPNSRVYPGLTSKLTSYEKQIKEDPEAQRRIQKSIQSRQSKNK